MATIRTKLVVLGGGPGGYAAAFLAADLGMQVTLVEQDPRLGGTCLLRGCIPSKALLHVAAVLGESAEMSEWGIEFPQPKIALDRLRARKEKVLDTLSGGLAQLAKQRKVEVIHGQGVFIDSQNLRIVGETDGQRREDRLLFEHCILATGSSPTKIPAFDLPTDRVMDSTGALELKDIPDSLLVVGGGYIGLEMGSVYAALGTRVSVVELTDGLLPGADRDLVRPLHERLKKRFAAIHLKTKVAALKDLGEAIEVTFEGPEGKAVERYSRVLVSVGRRPNTSGFGLENTKVEINQRGFVVIDKQQRTRDPHILAIGDVAGEPMLAHKASHEGKVAVEFLHGEAASFEPAAIPAVVFTDPEIAWAGLTEEDAKKRGIAVEITRFPWAASGRAQALGRTEGMTKLIVEPETERVLGLGIVGPGAGDLISEGVLAIEMGAVARELSDTIHPHPTLSETLPFAAEVYFGTATDFYRPKRSH